MDNRYNRDDRANQPGQPSQPTTRQALHSGEWLDGAGALGREQAEALTAHVQRVYQGEAVSMTITQSCSSEGELYAIVETRGSDLLREFRLDPESGQWRRC